jgi:hypothetical protein
MNEPEAEDKKGSAADQADPSTRGCSEGEGSEFRERGRKERVLHTRISEQLAEDIRRVADDLRLPVSNLVRNVLEETFGVVESVTDNLGTWLEDVATEMGEARGPSAPRPRRWTRSWGRPREGAGRPSSSRDEAIWENSWDEPSAAPPQAHEEAPTGTSSAPGGETAYTGAPRADMAPANRERPDFSQVLGWQPLVMNRPQACADCGRLLVRGDRASLGFTPSGASGWVLCRACMDTQE